MDLMPDNGAIEQAILAVLTGTPISEAAAWMCSSPQYLAQAVDMYRTAGQAVLDARPWLDNWHQMTVEFADYRAAEPVFLAYLLPALREATNTGLVKAWWFSRAYPCWQLQIASSSDTSDEAATASVTAALNSAASWGVVNRWRSASYDPETTAFGGPDGMNIAHGLFHADSNGVLDFLHRLRGDGSGLLDAKATSLIVISRFLRAAGQDWHGQGDVWSRVEAKNPMPDNASADCVFGTTERFHELLAADTAPFPTAYGPLTEWIYALEQCGQALSHATHEGQLDVDIRGVLAEHIIFHWNRMGFTTHQQAIWARAARTTILGD